MTIIPDCMIVYNHCDGYYLLKEQVKIKCPKVGKLVLIMDKLCPAFFTITRITETKVFLQYEFKVIGYDGVSYDEATFRDCM